jgi:hypothetical protein
MPSSGASQQSLGCRHLWRLFADLCGVDDFAPRQRRGKFRRLLLRRTRVDKIKLQAGGATACDFSPEPSLFAVWVNNGGYPARLDEKDG